MANEHIDRCAKDPIDPLVKTLDPILVSFANTISADRTRLIRLVADCQVSDWYNGSTDHSQSR